jgi:hypothetical protein
MLRFHFRLQLATSMVPRYMTDYRCVMGSMMMKRSHRLLEIYGWLETKMAGQFRMRAEGRMETSQVAGWHKLQRASESASDKWDLVKPTFSRYCVAAQQLYFSCISIPFLYPPSGP